MQHLDAKAQERDSCLHPHPLVIKSPTAVVGKGGGDGKFYPANISTSLLHHRHPFLTMILMML